MGHFGEFQALTSVSRTSQMANAEPHAVTEAEVAFGSDPQLYALVLAP